MILILLVDVFFLYFFSLYAIMPRRRVWAREQILSRRVLATCLSWVRAVLLVSCVLRDFFPFVVDERAGLGKGGRDDICRVLEGFACVADGDADEVDVSPVPSYGAEKGVVLLDLLGELVMATEVFAEADFHEDEGIVLAVEGGGVRRGVDWHSSGVDDFRGSSRSYRYQVV